MKVRTCLVWLCLSLALAACGAGPNPGPARQGATGSVASVPTEQDLLASAAAEATAIVLQAKATALVLEARAQATALVKQAAQGGTAPTPTLVRPVIYLSPTPPPPGQTAEPPAVEEAAVPVEVTGVSFATEGSLIMVRFLAPPEVAEKWWPGTVSVTDEGNGAVYNEVPVMPKIGPLIGRPKFAGQAGYVMLINAPPYLQPGASVTVVLGQYEFEHVPVQ
jgi:hypothetical protein